MKYFIIAGEASGDLHGSNLIKGLKKEQPDCQIRCWGGDLMKEAGGELVSHYKDTAVMGFFEVAMKLGKILGNFRKCRKDILDFNPDAVILIDYPGFNFRMAKFAKKKGFKVFYYIAPKIWAWKESRGKRLRKYVDKLFIIFPFEIDYFKNRWNIEAIYKGNPLLDSIEDHPDINEGKEKFCSNVGSVTQRTYSPQDKFIALLAGSRRTEISYQLPVMLDIVRMFPQFRFILAAAPSIPEDYYRSLIARYCSRNRIEADEIDLPIVYGQTYPRIAKVLIMKSLKYISLANLILDKLIFKEFIQHDASRENLAAELHRLLEDKPYVETMKNDYAQVRRLLGGGGASRAVAKAMIEELSKLQNDR